MCNNCNKKSCSGCKKSTAGKDIGSLQSVVNELSSTIEQIMKDTVFLKKGHPIMMLQNADDIAAFSLSTGLGSGDTWEGWAICNGGTYQNSITGKDFVTPNMLNNFPVGAGDNYSVNDTGGLDGVVLTTPELPVHSHGVTDAGHTHNITDPGHNHGASSSPHTHNINTSPHNHTTDASGIHSHEYQLVQSYSYSAGPAGASLGQLDLGTNSTQNTFDAGSHTHPISNATVAASAESTAVTVTVQDSFVGITETDSHTSGVTINNAGAGEEHENRPPFVALLFVMKL